MMKRYLMATTLVVAAAGAVGVGAGSTVNLKGSDTLFDFTNAVLSACPGTAGPYAGTGSGNGQAAMLAGTQQVAPMSRFLNNGACTGTAASPSTSEGLVVALDSILIVGANQTFGGTACNGDANVNCDSSFEPTTGAAYNTTVAGYTFNGWRDVLRVLLAGMPNTVTSTGASAWAARDCNSAVRQAIANSYGSMFENNCGASSGDAIGTCTQIRHIFRRDDFSGTTDTIVSLLNLPSIVNPETTVGGVVQHTGATPFCNAVRPAFVFPSPAPTCLQGADATWDPTQKNTPTGCTKETAVLRSTMQDNDPIRRTCSGAATGAVGTVSEDNCSHSGDLGLVLTMNDVPEVSPHTNADRYNATPCVRGHFTSVTPPDVYDAITQGKQICTRGLLCPNGDVCTQTGGCLAPVDATSSPQCLASKLTTYALTISNVGVPLVNPKTPSVNDGRSYNQNLYVLSGSAGAYQMNGFSTPLPMTGAFYRIHTNHTLQASGNDSGAPPTCQLPDMTSQIGCLVSASPCSIGYAGRQAITSNTNAAAIKINKQSPALLCVQGNFLYPLSRKLYLSTVTGFQNVTGQELQLVGCETDLQQPSLGIGADAGATTGIVTNAVAASGFIQIGAFVNNGEPFCEDFNEQMLCSPAVANVDACLVKPNLDNWTAFDTVCGDGNTDVYEDCDMGNLNGPPPATCSTTCRNN
jgi:hypothetical protein